MKSYSQIERLTLLTKSFQRLFPEYGFVLLNEQKQVLHLKAMEPMDASHLPWGTLQIQDYLGLGNGGVALANSPDLTGGPGSLFVVYKFDIPELGGRKSGFLLGMRLNLNPQNELLINAAADLPPIPPLPVGQDHVLNLDLLKSIGAALPHFGPELLTEKVRGILKIRDSFQYLLRLYPQILHPQTLKLALQKTAQDFESLLDEFEGAQTEWTLRLGPGVSFRAALAIEDAEISVHFEPQEWAEDFSLDDQHFYGATLLAILNNLDGYLSMNESLFERIKVSPPQRSKRAITKEQSDAVPLWLSLLTSQLTLKFQEIFQRRTGGENARGPFRVEFSFPEQRGLNLFLRGGYGAHNYEWKKRGYPWQWNREAGLSIEQFEEALPVSFQAIGPRPHSGGKGAKPGGDGFTMALQVNEATQMKWHSLQLTEKAKGADDGKSGQVAQLQVGPSTTEDVRPSGEVDIPANSVVKIHLGGGGGYGPPPA